MAKEKINKTNACRILDQKKVAYELIPYEVDENDLGATSTGKFGTSMSAHHILGLEQVPRVWLFAN